MLTFFVFVIVLGVLVFIHELGHFVLAKHAGVNVETFSLGFGPRLLGWRRGDTDYRVSAIPLGGYVKMTGEDPKDEEAARTDSFAAKPVGARMRIVLAGPLMNLLLPFLLMPAVYLIGIHRPAFLEQPPVVGWVYEDSPAEKAGILPGDRILRIQGKEVPTWDEARLHLILNPNRTLSVDVRRGDRVLHLSVTPEAAGVLGGYTGIQHFVPPAIGTLIPDMPAAKAGLQEGDLILAVDGRPVHHWAEMARIIRHHPEEPLRFSVQRDGETFEVTIRPERDPETDTGRLGIVIPPEEEVFVQHGLAGAFAAGCREIGQTFVLTFQILGKLVTGGLSIKTLGGPVKIAEMTGQAARMGLSNLLYFVAFLSIQLGVLNLLPIPVLDGGHVLFLGLEGLRGRPISARFRDVSQQVGFVLLMLFILVITYNDVLPHIERLFR